MSRSRRRPYTAITGIVSAKNDKRMAHHGVRGKQNRALRTCFDFENLLLPHPFECPWNNNWCWDRDGKQYYVSAKGVRYSRLPYAKLLRK
jgi:hypothetical protein